MTSIGLKRFQKEMKRQRVGLSLFFSLDGDTIDPNIVYFTQYTGLGFLAITQNGAVLIVSQLEYMRAKHTCKVRVVGVKGSLIKGLKQTLRTRPQRIGIDKNRVSLNFYRALRNELDAKYIDIADLCRRLRAVKTAEEVAIISKACRMSDEIFQKTFWNFKKFRTEAQVAAFMMNEASKRGLGLSFKPIVASGRNACEAHHEPDTKRLRKGFCVIDFGVKYKGYCSDTTRTIYLGSPSKAEVEMYYEVLEVQTTLIGRCLPGKSFIEIDQEARELFGSRAKYFIHLIGHGVGTEIHEDPSPKRSSSRSITDLEVNNVITIEPGLYYPKLSGIRIEDDILVTKNGPKVLTMVGKNLLLIGSK